MAAQDPEPPDQWLSISSLIRKVHEELVDSQRRRQTDDNPPLFEVESLTIEAHFVVTSTAEGKGGIDLKIVNLGAASGTKAEQVHKIILKLKTVSDNVPSPRLTDPEMAPDGRRPRPVEGAEF
jgi:Trypsin-co-occurring domain 2